MRYRRTEIKGGTYFFTINLLDRKSSLFVDEIDLLRIAINHVKKRHPFRLDAMVVLPEHFHAIITLPEEDSNYAIRWSLIKSAFSKKIPVIEKINQSRMKKRERGIWQRPYWEHLIRDESDFKSHLDYIHFNPVKHGYVMKPSDWPYSTIHRYIEKRIIDENWGHSDHNALGECGER